MRAVLIIALSSLIGTIYGQLKPEDVFYTGEHFNEKECRVMAYPNWGHLVILSSDRFYSFNFNKSKHNRDTMILVGNYKIYGDTLQLTSIKWAMALSKWVSKDTIDFENRTGYEWMKKIYPEIKFKITKCSNGQILLVGLMGNQFWYAMREPDSDRTVRRMKEDGRWEYLLR